MKKNRRVVLVVASHPDDEVLGCGGTIARHIELCDLVYVLILGEGISSRHASRETVKKKEYYALKKQAIDAANLLGVKEVFFSDLPDNSFDSVPILKIIKEIERIKRITRPEIIYTHHYGDLNIDHRTVYKAVMTAFRPIEDETVRELYSFEVPSSTEWFGPNKDTYFLPDRFVDITKTIEKKLKALKFYREEIRVYPHPRSIQAIRKLAQKRGSEVGLESAEAFETIRTIVT